MTTQAVSGEKTQAGPTTWQRRLMGLRAWFYRHVFGRFFGSRLVVLVHSGRRSGLERHAVLEVLEHRRVQGEYRVLSGWGRRSDWFQNLEAAPPVALLVGGSRLSVTHRILERDEAAAAVCGHLRANPRTSRMISPDLWYALESGHGALARELEATPVVAFQQIDRASCRGEAAVAGDSAKVEAGGVGALPTVEGAGLIVTHLILTPFIGRRRLRWGATVEEVQATMPGDELVPQPKWSFTYAVSIDASLPEVWSWIVQIGQNRGGFYSYQTLENLVGCRIENIAEIRPELQHPAVGDPIYLHPESPPMRIAVIDAPCSLVLHGAPADTGQAASSAVVTWQFLLTERSDGSTRLLMRGRNDYGATPLERLSFGRFPLEPITFVMSRKMLLEVKRLAEQAT